MVKIYTNEEYAKSYTELIEILKYFPKFDLIKIPKYIIKSYIKDKDTNYEFCYNPELDICEQNVSKLTQILLANLYIEYLADENEREYIKNKDLIELAEIEKQKQEKYDIETIFSKKKNQYFNNTFSETTSLAIVSAKTNIIKKIFEKIRKFFKLK